MIEIAILVVVMGGGAVALKLLNGGGDQRLDEAWRIAARRVGGELELTEPRFLTPRERRIRVKVEGAELCLETIIPRSVGGRPGEVETTVTSSGFTSPFGLSLQVQKRDLLRKLSKKLGIGEHPIGVPAFDDAFLVNGTPCALAIELLDGPTQRVVEAASEGFTIHRNDLAIRISGAPNEAEPIVAMMRFAVDLVERCAGIARAPSLLADALDLALEPRTPRRPNGDLLVATGVVRTREIALAVRVDDERALTIVSFVDHGQPDWTLERSDAAFELRAGEPSEALRSTVVGAPSALLGLRSLSETIELAFDGLAPDHDGVADALAIVLDALAPLAPYR